MFHTLFLPVYILVGLLWWAWCTSILWLDQDEDDLRFAWRVLPWLVLMWPLDVAQVLAMRVSK